MPGDDHGSDDAASSTARNDDATDDAATDDDATDDAGEYDKLVRDDVPAVVRSDGNRPVTRRVDGREYDRYLAAKLQEEVDEVLDAFASRDAASTETDDEGLDERDDELLGELADVHAVLEATAGARGHSMAAVRDRARAKTDARGGFADGVVLERIDPPASGERDDETNQS